MDPTDINQRAMPSVNRPDSGTYGEKADLNRLKAALPDMASAPSPTGAQQGQASSAPPVSVSPLTAGQPAPPSPLMAPTMMPDIPVNTPLTDVPAPLDPSQLPPEQSRLMVLELLANNPKVSAETRNWAATYRDRLLRGNRND